MSAVAEERDGRHARWDDHREERRRLILQAALEVVEQAPPGYSLRLQDVAARAGLVRTVVQRHFGGQIGLLREAQVEVLRRAFGHIAVPLVATDSLATFMGRVVRATIEWVDANLALHALIELEVGDGEPSELSIVIAAYADHLAQIGTEAAAVAGVRLSPTQVAELRLLFVGVVAQVRGTVTTWSVERPRRLDPERVRELLSSWIVSQLESQLTAYGVPLAVDTPLGLVTTEPFDAGECRARGPVGFPLADAGE